jgi:hypothetical protein
MTESWNDTIEALVGKLAGLSAADSFLGEPNALSAGGCIE